MINRYNSNLGINTDKIVRKESIRSNKDYKNGINSDFNNTIKKDKMIVSVSVEGRRFPIKTYSKGMWLLELSHRKLKIVNELTKKIEKEVTTLEIKDVNIRLSEAFNNSPGVFITQSICLEANMTINSKKYQFAFEDINVVPFFIKWLNENKLNYIDNYGLKILCENNKREDIVPKLYEKFKQELKNR